MNIKDVKPTLNSGYRQGYFIPKNPEKYAGDASNIIYRSSWEFKFMDFCDNAERVVEWGSENVAIAYFNPLTKKPAKYWIDCYMKTKSKDGVEIRWLIEVKPNKYLEKPSPPQRLTESGVLSYARHAKAYLINSAKFEAAQDYARTHNMKFGIITENFLFNRV
jgi:hypothetical protein